MSLLPTGLTLRLSETPDAAFRDYLINGITAHHADFLPPVSSLPLAIMLQNEHGAWQGGLVGRSWQNWLFIELLFVPQALRGQGLGHALLTRAEIEAKNRGCTGLWLDTLNPAALAFYLRHGFESFGELANYPNQSRRVFLRKSII
ncbi:MAG: GNAT family N-acetyltransferase [Acidocella sp.]|nr:GNAT family N-acetyltransferase [Acidocella sp.]